jgi:hypothetical protein
VASAEIIKKLQEIVMVDPASATIIGLSVFCMLGLFVALVLMIKLRRSRKEIQLLLDVSPESHQFVGEDNVPGPAETVNPFGDAIFEAETKKRLKEGISDRQVPEKYRYAPCLLKRGLKNEEIAEVLNLSFEEVDQIAKLTHIALQVEKATVH